MTIIINGTTGISGVDGSAGTPSLQGQDTNTGFFYGTDILGFSTGGSERMRIDASGNVGIGLTAPTRKLTVYNGTTDTDVLVIANPAVNLDSAQHYVGMLFADNSIGDGGNYSVIRSFSNLYNTWGTSLLFYTTGTSGTGEIERMCINSAGNVGIGTSSPSQKLDVSGTIKSSGYFVGATGAGGYGALATTVTTSGGGVVVVRDSASTYNASGIEFYAGGGEKMRIDSSGNLMLSANSPQYSSRFTIISPATSSAIGIYTSGTGGTSGYILRAGDDTVNTIFIYTNGNIQNKNNSYGAISDESLKENIVDATPKLNDLLKVQVRNFNLKSDNSKTKQIGVIAQELEQVFPAMVETDADGIKGVKYSVFVPMLVKAIQELTARIEQLEAK